MRPRMLLLGSSLLLAMAACSQPASDLSTTAAAALAASATVDGHQASIDALFAEQAVADAPGGAVSVYRDGKLVFAKGYGTADLESGQPITPQTRFHVASVSKQFTAFSIALLAKEGRIDLDADIRTYLPYVPDLGHRITVRHLILHTSGLRDQWALFGIGGQSMDGRLTQQQVINMVTRQQGLNFTPGSEYMYCNTGYTLLAEIVFEVSGKTLREFTAERIFKPLGMDRTFFFDDLAEIVPHRANSYARRLDKDGKETDVWERKLLNYDNVGATSLFTTVEDLAKWAGNFTRPVVGDKALIDQISTNGTLDDGTPIDYGFALARGELDGRTIVSHSGADAGFRALFVYYPEHDFAVSITANTPFDMMDKVGRIADLYLPAVAKTAQAGIPAEDCKGDLARFVGTYITPYSTALRLEHRDGALYHVSGRGEPQKLILRTDGRLDFGKPEQQSFTPVLSADGKLVGLDEVGKEDTVRQRLQRIDAHEVPAADLARYSGDYHSPELDITYSVNVVDDRLEIAGLWTDKPIGLQPVQVDRFESTGSSLGTVIFQRDGGGRINGLMLHNGRARNIRLDRVGNAHAPVPAASSEQ